MVPVNQPLPTTQIDGRNGQRYVAGVNGPDEARAIYSMGWHKDNWTYFGTTAFLASSAAHYGQITPWQQLPYVNSTGGNNAGTANPGAAQRQSYRGYVEAR